MIIPVQLDDRILEIFR